MRRRVPARILRYRHLAGISHTDEQNAGALRHPVREENEKPRYLLGTVIGHKR